MKNKFYKVFVFDETTGDEENDIFCTLDGAISKAAGIVCRKRIAGKFGRMFVEISCIKFNELTGNHYQALNKSDKYMKTYTTDNTSKDFTIMYNEFKAKF